MSHPAVAARARALAPSATFETTPPNGEVGWKPDLGERTHASQFIF
jgi:hypothetical protein